MLGCIARLDIRNFFWATEVPINGVVPEGVRPVVDTGVEAA